MLNSLKKIDIKILDFIDRYIRCALLDKVMPIITSIGDGGLVWIFVSIYLICSSSYKTEGYMVITSLILVTILGEGVIKHLIRRSRPFISIKGKTSLISRPMTYSFPSGHSASSFAVAGIFIIMNSRISVYIILIASLIAFSRLYLNVHYPTDVLTGIILGFLCSVLVYDIFNRIDFEVLVSILLYKYCSYVSILIFCS